MGWICNCGEGHEDIYDSCWNCKTPKPALVPKTATVPTAANPVTTTRPVALLADERVLATLGGSSIVLTTHRVRQYHEESGSTSMTSIMLEQVASCSTTSLSKPWLLIAAAAVLVLSLANAGENRTAWIFGLLVALVFAGAYFATRRDVLSIASAGATLDIDLATTPETSARSFIDEIENAKNARYLLA